MSLLKYMDDRELRTGNGRGSVSLGRAHLDGMPHRGPSAMLRSEEFDAYNETVNDGHVRLFNMQVDDDAALLAEVVDRWANGWYQVHKMQEKLVEQADGSLHAYVFCVWTAPYKELARHRLPTGVLPNRA